MIDLLTTQEAATLLDLSPHTLAKWRSDPERAPKNGGPRYVRIGRGIGKVRYRRADLEKWVDELPTAV